MFMEEIDVDITTENNIQACHCVGSKGYILLLLNLQIERLVVLKKRSNPRLHVGDKLYTMRVLSHE